MGTRFIEFPQTPRCRVSPYLSFIPILSVLLMFRLNQAVRGRWIGPKTWDRIDIIFERKNGAAHDCSTAIWVVLSVHSCVNHVLV